NILAAAGSVEEAKQQAANTQIRGNRLAFRGDTHYRYDTHGNRIAALRGKNQKLQTRYHYNSRQQLTRVEQLKIDDNGQEQLQQQTHYQYDPLGRRVAKTDSDQHTDFLWDGDLLLRETVQKTNSGETAKTRTYYFEPGTFKPIALDENGELYHYHLDHLGTPDTLTDSQGEIAWSVSYTAYGNLAIKHCNRIEQPIRFQGQYYDEETGLHYNRFRYYDPEVGAFTQQDPIGLLGGINNYRYVPNPVGWVDPYGLTCKENKPDFYVGPSGPSSTLPSTAYRYDRYLNDDGTLNEWGQKILANKSGRVTYFGFDKYETASEASDAFQIKTKKHLNPLDPEDRSWSDSRLRSEFDTLQLYENGIPRARVPRAYGDKIGAEPEPFTTAYPEFGKGGARQLHANGEIIKFNRTDILPEE
ncbi:RHS repeat domain-containing protein, partial [Microbulbifer thermotolerans]|uniref:RHS repeat domain-containing protein n=1 Tax=Microbulbifer thermotolerans TaxID=252514 RepID=UPI0022494566